MTSRFKFLDPYEKADAAIFFGRQDEIEELYRLVFETDLVLVYGQSGTGKTSLIQCGLANRFQPTDFLQVFVRRQEDINKALDREVRSQATTEIPPGASIEEAVGSLYLDHLRPVYLIFDQFEELFILGSLAEQDAFIATCAGLLACNASCKIIISLREEYLAMLHRFEKAVPTLFNKRLRVEPMSMANVRDVILRTTEALGITLEHGADTAQKIIDNLDDPRAGVQLAYLQVYLDRLDRRAQPGADGKTVFTDLAVEETGNLGDLLEDYLEEQTDAIQAALATRYPAIDKDAVQQLLEEFVTIDGTKQPIAESELQARLPKLGPALGEALSALETSRLLRPSDNLLELAHDSLAARIAERRSAERKSLLLVEKLVRDRLAAFDQTHTWLNRDEIAVVRRVRPRLELSDAEAAFVHDSARKAFWGRVRKVASWSLVPILLLFAAGVGTWESLNTDEAVVRAHDDTEKFARSIYSQLAPLPDSARVRGNLLKEATRIHIELDDANGSEGTDRFWPQLYAADAARERGRTDQAMLRLTMLSKLVQGTSTGDDDLMALVKQRILNARMAEIEHDPARRLSRNIAMLNRLHAANYSDYADFSEDIDALCKQVGADAPRLKLPQACE